MSQFKNYKKIFLKNISYQIKKNTRLWLYIHCIWEVFFLKLIYILIILIC
jgi:hypothetical protein